MRKFFFILAASIAAGLVVGLFRYDDGCLRLEHRILTGALNAFVIMSAAALFVSRHREGAGVHGYLSRSFFPAALLSGLAAALLATGLSIAIVKPLTAPEPWRFADYAFVFFTPGLILFLVTVHVMRLRERNREFASALRDFRADAPGDAARDGKTATSNASGMMVRGREIASDRIVYVSSNRKRSVLHTEDGDFEINLLLKDVLAKLPENFLRVHKSYLVNIHRVERVEYQFGGTYRIALRDEDDTVLPAGRSFVPRLRAMLQGVDVA